MLLPEVTAQSSVKTRLLQGHPWVYRNQTRGGEYLRSGAWVHLRCGNFNAIGMWDATSPIAVRIFSRTTVPNAAWFQERVSEAWEIRASIRASDTNAYRWLYGEGDGVPGVVVDRYGDYAIIQTYAESLETLVPLIVAALRSCDPSLRGIVTRSSETSAEPDAEPLGAGKRDPANQLTSSPSASLQCLWGELPPEDLVIQEHGLYLHANLYVGQKTGLFLDQRENRRTIEAWAGGRHVLNCFAYTGGFALYAVRGGAAMVVNCDSSQQAAAAAAENFRLNGIDPTQHPFLVEDCFHLLTQFNQQQRLFDMIILDPPSFARAKTGRYAALRAYTRLNTLALRCVAPGGVLVSASCTSQIAPEQFHTILADAATQAKRRLLIVHESGQPADHPVPVGFPEGRYLKFVIAQALEAL